MRGQAELNCVGSPAGLLDGLALAIALFQKTQVVLDIFVGGILALGSHKRRVRAFVVAAQHIRIALIVQNLGRRSKDADRLTIGAISKIKTPQAIIGCGKAEPGLCVARMQLDGAAEMLLGDAVIVRAIILLAELSSSYGSLPSKPGVVGRAPNGGGTVPVVVSSVGFSGSDASAFACAAEASSDGGLEPNRLETLVEKPLDAHPASQRVATITTNPRAIPVSMPKP